MQALDIRGARSRNRTGTPLRAGDFKSHASTSFAIRAVARCCLLSLAVAILTGWPLEKPSGEYIHHVPVKQVWSARFEN